MENKKDFNFSTEFKEVFRYLYDEVKKYNDKNYIREKHKRPSYLGIMDYISGHLSTDGDIDQEWFFNERDLKDFREEVIDEIYQFCRYKIWEENGNFITEYPEGNIFTVKSENLLK